MPPISYWSSSWWNVAVLWSRASLCRICISHNFQITDPIRVIKSCQANSSGDSWRGTFTLAPNSQSLFLQPPQYHNSRAIYKRRPNCGCFCHLVEWWIGWLHLLLDNRAEREGKKKKAKCSNEACKSVSIPIHFMDAEVDRNSADCHNYSKTCIYVKTVSQSLAKLMC